MKELKRKDLRRKTEDALELYGKEYKYSTPDNKLKAYVWIDIINAGILSCASRGNYEYSVDVSEVCDNKEVMDGIRHNLRDLGTDVTDNILTVSWKK